MASNSFKQSHSCLRETNLFIEIEPCHSGALKSKLVHTQPYHTTGLFIYPPPKHQKISSFLMLSGGIESDQ